VTKPLVRFRPFTAPVLFVCTAVGALVLAGIAMLTLLPLLVAGAVVLAWAALAVLLAWAGIEGMAALERWFENDSRFQR
jgi:hypothetical protein